MEVKQQQTRIKNNISHNKKKHPMSDVTYNNDLEVRPLSSLKREIPV